LTGLSFLVTKNHLNKEVLTYKQPLIVIVAPKKLYSEQTICGQKIVMRGCVVVGVPNIHMSRNTAHVQ